MWVCLFILIQKGYCYHCMTKPVVAIYNVSKTIVCVCFLSEPHSNEYGIRLLNTDDSTTFFVQYTIVNCLCTTLCMCARIFPCRVFFKRTETSSTHILTSVIKLPNCLELVQNKFCRKKSKMNVLVECARVWCVGTMQIWILKSILWNYQSNTKSLIVRIYLELKFYFSEDIFIIIQITRWRFFANFTYLPYCVLPCIAWQ